MLKPLHPILFRLIRKSDPTGISGTGYVADGVLFTSGMIAVSWRGEHPTVTVYADPLTAIPAIHGHMGDTVVQIDPRTDRALSPDEGHAMRQERAAWVLRDAFKAAGMEVWTP